MAADPAAARLIEIANNKKLPASVRLAANKEILDRADVTGKTVVEVVPKMSKWEQLADGGQVVMDIEQPGDNFDEDNIVDAEVVEDLAERKWDREMEQRQLARGRLKKRAGGVPPSFDVTNIPSDSPEAEAIHERIRHGDPATRHGHARQSTARMSSPKRK